MNIPVRFLITLSITLYGFSVASAAPNRDDLRILVDCPDGKQRARVTHNGEMEPVGMLPNQVVTITLDFPKEYAGGPLEISPLDGGRVNVQSPLTLPANGRITFTYRADDSPGMCHLFVSCVEQYQIRLFVVDPRRFPGLSQNGSAH